MAQLSQTIIVVGGGPTGLAAALAIAARGLSVALVAPKLRHDSRSTALLDGSVRMLRRLGVWGALSGNAAPLRRMRIVDATGGPFRMPELLFDSTEIGLAAFGYTVGNDALNGALHAAIKNHPAIRLYEQEAVAIAPGPQSIAVTLADGETIFGALVVGADGRNSPSRNAAGIGTRGRPLQQIAVVANVRHDKPHGDTSTEFHTGEGPFNLAPLAENRSGVVCVVRPETAAALEAMDDDSLSAELTARSHHLLGDLRVEGGRGVFPLTNQVATSFARNRVALVGEAAHVMPPIGAQGFNLGLRDVAALAKFLDEAGDPGGPPLLAAYDRARRADIGTRTFGVDLLNRSLLTSALPVLAARAAGFAALATGGPLRRLVMRQGLAPD